MKYLKYLKQFDYLSSEAKLTFNLRGKKKMKTIIGGIISMVAIVSSVTLTIYFFVEFITKNNKTLISSNEYSPAVNITYSHKMPFLLRLSNVENSPYQNPERIYKIRLKYWFGGKLNATSNKLQEHIDIDVEKCDINKHFGDFKKLFENITDLNTFFCPVLRNPNETIYGLYGNIKPYGFYHFHIYKCIKENENNECEDESKIDELLSDTYLDMRTVDYSINSQNSEKVKTATIRTDRHMVSDSVYKRIWMYIDWVDYVTDKGFFFSDEETENFHQVNSIRYDVDLRDIGISVVPGTFLTVSILTTGQTLIYNRHFLKFQEYLASIGGITKFISTVGFLLNYYVSQNSYYIKLINGFVFEHYHDDLDIHSKKYSSYQENNIRHFIKNKSIENKNSQNKKEISQISKNLDNETKKKGKLKVKWYKLFIPFSFSTYKSRFYREKYFLINRYLNIFELMKTIEFTRYHIKNNEQLNREALFQSLSIKEKKIIDRKKTEPKNLKKNSVILLTKEWPKTVKTGTYCGNESNVNIINSMN